MKWRKVLSVCLSVLLTAGLIPGFALRPQAAMASFDLWVAGTRVTGANFDNVLGDGTVSFDPDTATLTLNGANLTAANEPQTVYEPFYPAVINSALPTLTICLVGENTITPPDTDTDGIDAGAGRSVILTGDGSLTIEGGYYGFYLGDWETPGADLTVDGATLNVVNTAGTGIWVNHDITFTDATVNVSRTSNALLGMVSNVGGTVTVTDSDVSIVNVCSGILFGNDSASDRALVLNSGTLSITVSDSDFLAMQFDPEKGGAITVNGGTLDVTSAGGGTDLSETQITIAEGLAYLTGTSLRDAGHVVIGTPPVVPETLVWENEQYALVRSMEDLYEKGGTYVLAAELDGHYYVLCDDFSACPAAQDGTTLMADVTPALLRADERFSGYVNLSLPDGSYLAANGVALTTAASQSDAGYWGRGWQFDWTVPFADMMSWNVSGRLVYDDEQQKFCLSDAADSETVSGRVGMFQKVCPHENVEVHAADPASCTAAGTLAYSYCPDCGSYFDANSERVPFAGEEDFIDYPLGHHFVDGACTECSAAAKLYELVTAETVLPKTGATYILVKEDNGVLGIDRNAQYSDDRIVVTGAKTVNQSGKTYLMLDNSADAEGCYGAEFLLPYFVTDDSVTVDGSGEYGSGMSLPDAGIPLYSPATETSYALMAPGFVGLEFDEDGQAKYPLGIEIAAAGSIASLRSWNYGSWGDPIVFDDAAGAFTLGAAPNLYLYASVTAPAAVEYEITVEGGTAAVAKALPGATVAITADTPADGMAFVQWSLNDGVDFAQTDAAETTFTMPAHAVTLHAVFKEIVIGKTLDDVVYTGEAFEPTFGLFGVTLDGTDAVFPNAYTLSYANNVNVGTATVTVTLNAPRTGSKSATFQILPADISTAVVEVADQTYTGAALTPAPTVTWNGHTLVEGLDYDLSYENNKEIGRWTVTVTGNGNFDPNTSASAYFNIILPPPTSYDLWIAGVQVTSANAADLTVIDGVNVTPGAAAGAASYDPATATLTLENVTIDGPGYYTDNNYANIAVKSTIPTLTIAFSGTSSVGAEGISNYCNAFNGLYTALVLSGADEGASLTFSAKTTPMAENGAVRCASLTVTGGSVYCVAPEAQYVGNPYWNNPYGVTLNASGGDLLTVTGGTLICRGWAPVVAGPLEGRVSEGTALVGSGSYDGADPEDYDYSANGYYDGNSHFVGAYRWVKAEAEPVVPYELWIGGVQVTSANKNDVAAAVCAAGGTAGGSAVYDPLSNTLTLTDFTYSGPGYQEADTYPECGAIYTKISGLTLVVHGTNTVTETGGVNGHYSSNGMTARSGLTILGDGVLNLNGSTSRPKSNGHGQSRALLVSGTLTIGSATDPEGFTGTLNAVGGDLSNPMNTDVCHGLAADTLKIYSGTVYAKAGNNGGGHSYGIITTQATIYGGTVTAVGGTPTNGSSYGFGRANLTVNGGTVILIGETNAFIPSFYGSYSITLGAGMTALGSAHTDGSEAAPWQAGSLGSYKYLKIQPLTQYPITVVGGAAYSDEDRTAVIAAAAAGTTVYLNVDFPDGQYLESFTCDEAVIDEWTSSFTMPETAVTVTFTFADQTAEIVDLSAGPVTLDGSRFFAVFNSMKCTLDGLIPYTFAEDETVTFDLDGDGTDDIRATHMGVAVQNAPSVKYEKLEDTKLTADSFTLDTSAIHSAAGSVTFVFSTAKSRLKAAIAEAADYHDEIKDDYPTIAAALKDAVDAAQAVYDDPNAAPSEAEDAKETLEAAVAAAEAAVQLAQDKATFEAEKAAQKAAADAMAQDGDSEACQAIIEAAKEALDALAYDESKPLSDNVQALNEILLQLAAALENQRRAEANGGEDRLVVIVTQQPYDVTWNHQDEERQPLWNYTGDETVGDGWKAYWYGVFHN